MKTVSTKVEAQEGNNLMMAVRAGDLDGLGTLFSEYHGALIGYFRRMGRSLETSEDLAQETFWRILKYRKSYDKKRPFRAWMYQIARNVMYDEAKRSIRRSQFIEEGKQEETELFARSESNVEAEVERDEQKDLLKQALAKMPEEKRELIVLCRFEEMPYAEIAGIFGCSVGALKVRLFRALQELKEVYLRIGGEQIA